VTSTRLGAFPVYASFDPRVPVHCVTPDLPGAIHRFYDSSPFSPSGRYLAVTRLPFEDRIPRPGEAADVVVIDLETTEWRKVAETRGWDTQLGAQVQWGADDRTLLYNDVDTTTWVPHGVRLDPLGDTRQRLDGTVYAVSPDGRWAASPCLRRIVRTQGGYGVIVPPAHLPANRGAATDDGIWLTDTMTGSGRLLVSLADLFEQAFPPAQRKRYASGDFYGFHVKWNPQGTRLLFVLRWLPRTWLPWRRKKKYRRFNVLTLAADGTGARIAVPDSAWRKGGNHPNWCPDGEHVLMNLNTDGEGLRFARVRYDGTGCAALSRSVRGSGHPTMHPDGRHILTDAYPHEPVAYGDGTTPIRWVRIDDGTETALVRIRTRSDHEARLSALRIDPHPAWDRGYRRIAFNACPDGRRRVFVADLDGVLAGTGPPGPAG
jgi:Tol biopolymer transport system component